MDRLNNNIPHIDDDTIEEIISELARVGRPDLIHVLRHHFNYTTESSESSEEYSDSEVVEETIEVVPQNNKTGFYEIK